MDEKGFAIFTPDGDLIHHSIRDCEEKCKEDYAFTFVSNKWETPEGLGYSCREIKIIVEPTQKQILDMVNSRQEEPEEIICKTLRESMESGGGFGILKNEFSKDFIDEVEEDKIVDSLILEDHLKGD